MRKSSSEKQDFDKEVYKLTIEEAIDSLKTNKDTGLTSAEAQSRQQRYGVNAIEGDGGVKWYSLLMKQISNAMILVLVLAMALSYGVTDYIEGGVITAVIVLNVVIGFYQEFQAEKKMDSLRSLASPSARVIRDGQGNTIPSGEVVPGDIIEIKMGDTVPADLRLFEVMNLAVDDAILTGESKPNSKSVDDYTPKLDQDGNEIPLVAADCKNLTHSSTTVTKGRARGVVVFTGMYTEIGRIAHSMNGKKRKANRSMSRQKHGPLQPVKGGALRVWDGIGKFLGLTEGTPLQIKLSKLAYVLFGCALILAIIVFGVNKFNVTNEVAIYAISTGIAIIPESLNAVLTITIVVGMTQMRKRRVVVRQLSALEALGGITNICSDKTGTLTKGKMVAHKAWVHGIGIYTVDRSGHSFQTSGTRITLGPAPKSKSEAEAEREQQRAFRDRQRSTAGLHFDVPEEKYQKDRQKRDDARNEMQSEPSTPDNDALVPEIVPELEAFLESAALCNLATIKQDCQTKEWKTTGDPTEVALQVLAHRFGSGKPTLLDAGWKQLAEHPFDSKIKMMSVIYQKDTSEEYIQFTKGASERVIEFCDYVGVGDHQEKMTEQTKTNILGMMDFLAEQGLRVLAIACKSSNEEAVRASSADQPEEAKDWDDNQKRAWEEEKESVRPKLIECNLTLLGLAGLYDPPRDETTDAVRGKFQMPSQMQDRLTTPQIVLVRVSKSTCLQATTHPLRQLSPKMWASSPVTPVRLSGRNTQTLLSRLPHNSKK
jgi:P-type Na+/K+ transporter